MDCGRGLQGEGWVWDGVWVGGEIFEVVPREAKEGRWARGRVPTKEAARKKAAEANEEGEKRISMVGEYLFSKRKEKNQDRYPSQWWSRKSPQSKEEDDREDDEGDSHGIS